MTRALLDLIPFDATLLAFEINSRFSQHLKSSISDSRLIVVNASAETLQTEVRRRGYERADAVISSLALGFMADCADEPRVSVALQREGREEVRPVQSHV